MNFGMSVHSLRSVLLHLTQTYAIHKESLAPENRICRVHGIQKKKVSKERHTNHREEPWGLS